MNVVIVLGKISTISGLELKEKLLIVLFIGRIMSTWTGSVGRVENQSMANAVSHTRKAHTPGKAKIVIQTGHSFVKLRAVSVNVCLCL